MVRMVLAERTTQPHIPPKSRLNLNRWKDFVRGLTSFHMSGQRARIASVLRSKPVFENSHRDEKYDCLDGESKWHPACCLFHSSKTTFLSDSIPVGSKITSCRKFVPPTYSSSTLAVAIRSVAERVSKSR